MERDAPLKTSGNTILVTGGGSGIGEALAHRFHDLGNTVIIAGRRLGALDRSRVGRANMHALTLDVDSAEGVADFARRVLAAHPTLNILINNAGIMRFEQLDRSRDLSDAEETVGTNLLGPIRLKTEVVQGAMPEWGYTMARSGYAYYRISVTTPFL